MRNMPKVIGTGKDVYNLLGMVQAGKLEAAELREAISGIEEVKYIFVPVIAISEDKRYITANYLAEAAKGAKVLCEGKEYTSCWWINTYPGSSGRSEETDRQRAKQISEPG